MNRKIETDFSKIVFSALAMNLDWCSSLCNRFFKSIIPVCAVNKETFVKTISEIPFSQRWFKWKLLILICCLQVKHDPLQSKCKLYMSIRCFPIFFCISLKTTQNDSEVFMYLYEIPFWFWRTEIPFISSFLFFLSFMILTRLY